MRKTNRIEIEKQKNGICVTRDVLPQLLGCGQTTADKIAKDAEARIKVGKRILIKLDKINQYLEDKAE